MSFYEALAILFSAAALVTSLIAFYRSEDKLIRANGLMAQANKKLEDANKIAAHTNHLAVEELRIKSIPDISVHPTYINVPWDDSDSNVIELEIRNNTPSDITVTTIEIRGEWQVKENLDPKKVALNKPYRIRLYIPDHERENVTAKVSKFEGREQYLFEEIVRSRLFRSSIYLECMGKYDDRYIFHLEYNREEKSFMGVPVHAVV